MSSPEDERAQCSDEASESFDINEQGADELDAGADSEVRRDGFSGKPSNASSAFTMVQRGRDEEEGLEEEDLTKIVECRLRGSASEPEQVIRELTVVEDLPPPQQEVTTKGVPHTERVEDETETTLEASSDSLQYAKGGCCKEELSKAASSGTEGRLAHVEEDPEEPGAYAVGGPLDDTPTSAERQPRQPDQQDTVDADIGLSSGLAVAHAVQETSLPVMAQPIAFNTDEREQEADGTVEQTKCWETGWVRVASLVSGAVFILMVVVGLVVSLGDFKSSSKSNIRDPSWSSDDAMATLLSVLPQATVKQIVSNATSSSYQALAAEFLVNDKGFPTYAPWRIRQRFALACLYHSTDGPNWKKQDDWLEPDTDECTWFAKPTHGITIANRTVTDHPFPCEENDDGVYRNLWLWSNRLRGSIPPELFLMTNLKSISLYSNDFEETSLPSQIGLLTDLEGINLGNSALASTLPSEFWQLTNLWAFVLSGNSFRGTLPPAIAGMSKMEFMLLDYNEFSGAIPTELGLLQDMVLLLLHSNQLNGTVPSELGQLTNVHSLDLSNRPESRRPEKLKEHDNVNKTCIMRNCLTGALPSELGNAHYLHRLDFGDNRLISTIPSELAKLSLLEDLELQANYLTGSINSQFGQLSNMRYLNLGQNLLTSTLPSELGKLVNLKEAQFYDTALTGAIPLEFASWRNLRVFHVSGSSGLSGSIPGSFCSAQYIGFDCSPILCGCDCQCEA